MAFTELSYEVNDHIGVITLRRPEAMNSLTYTLYMELEDAVRESDARVLVTGDNGTGKELSARAIHRLSQRNSKPLIMVNCPAIPEHLLESELFGHKRGAFTGAEHDHKGMFDEANGGTIMALPYSIGSYILTSLL